MLATKAACARSGTITIRPENVDKIVIPAAAFAIVTWSSAFPLIKLVLGQYSPEHFVALRYLAAFLSLIIFVRPKRLPGLGDSLRFLLCATLGLSLYNIALAYGEQRIAAGTASLLVSTSPIFSAIAARFLLKEKISRVGYLGLMLGFAGALLIACSGGVASFDLVGLAILVAAVFQGVYVVLNKPLLKKYTASECALYMVLAALLPMSFHLPGAIAELLHATLASTAALIYLGVVPAALGILAWGLVLAKTSASSAGSLLYLVPVLSLILSFLWLGEQPNLVSLVGGAIAVSGVMFAARAKQLT